MIEFGGKKIGCPWHGLYRQSSATILTPGGVVIDWFSDTPPTLTDTYLVAISGMPVHETTAAETSQGETWLNYAILSGTSFVTYGKAIFGPLYIDDAGQAWRLSVVTNGTRLGGELSVSITAQRFGFVGAGSAPTISLPTLSVAFGVNPDFPWPERFSGAVLLDVATNGRSLLCGVSHWGGFAAVAKIDISGSPATGDFAADIELLSDETSDDWSSFSTPTVDGYVHSGLYREYVWGAAPLILPGGSYPTSPGQYISADGINFAFNGSQYAVDLDWSIRLTDTLPPIAEFLSDGFVYAGGGFQKTSSWSCRFISGARFEHDGAEAVITTMLDYRLDYSASVISGSIRRPIGVLDGVAVADFSESMSESLTASVNAGSSFVTQCGHVCETTTTGQIYESVGGVGRRVEVDCNALLTSGDSPTLSLEYSQSVRRGPSVGPVRFGIPADVFSSISIGGIRCSNSIYQIQLPKINPLVSGDSLSLNYTTGVFIAGELCGRISSIASPAAELLPGSLFATEHPVSGDISASFDGWVCYC